MQSERFDATGGDVEGNSLKPDTTLQLDIDECNNQGNKNLDDTPPAMIIVETCINQTIDNHLVSTKQAERELESMEQAGCSITLGLKPNVQFNRLAQAGGNVDQLLSSTEAALVAANISCASEVIACNDLPISNLRRCVDGATQCNNLNLDCEASNSSDSMPSIGSLVCRICHNADNPEQLVSPCLCKGSLTYVHVHCLERWISTSRCTICELCQFHYNTEQTLRYTCLQSLRLWYSRAMSRRALQEDCQMFSLLTLVAFGIIGTLLVGIQYYALSTQSWGLSKLWTKSWMLFFLLMTVTVYFANVYMLIKSQLTPWYRWWQSARDIKLILENRRPFPNPNRVQPQTLDTASITASMFTHHDQLDAQRPSSQPTFVTPSSSAISLPREETPIALEAVEIVAEITLETATPPLETSTPKLVSKCNSSEANIERVLLGNNANATPKSSDCEQNQQQTAEPGSGN